MSNHEVETFEIRYSWFDILPFDWVAGCRPPYIVPA